MKLKRLLPHRIRSGFLLVTLLLITNSIMADTAKPACNTDPIKTQTGAVCGNIVESSSKKQAKAFLGIPFAESTAGKNRWQFPVPKAAWTDTFQATQFGAGCPQEGMPNTSEDCLSLNIWTPANVDTSKPLPVMVFIYGGAFSSGLSGHPLYDGAYLAANKNVIVVSFNYRVGVLGFLANDDLDGNYGFMDQELALMWVRKHIPNFGGDPKKVTLFGESAGAMSVGLHLLSSPLSQPLFRAAIVESNFFGLPYKTLQEQKNVGNLFEATLNCHDTECLRGLDVAKILEAQGKFTDQMSQVFSSPQFYLPFAPSVDGKLITRQPVDALADKKLSKPLLIGTNKDEAVLLVAGRNITPSKYATWTAGLYGKQFEKVIKQYPISETDDNSKVWSNLQTDNFLKCSSRYVASQYPAPVYTYSFNHSPSFNFVGLPNCAKDNNVCHIVELPFIFHTMDKLGGSFTPEEEKLSENFMDYWTNFAITLDPNDNGNKQLTAWPKFSAQKKQFLSLNTPTVTVEQDPDQKICDFWDGIGYELTNPWK